MFHLVTPNYRVGSVVELTPERLRLWGIAALLLDVDCTLTRYRRAEPTREVGTWIAQLRAQAFGLCLVSNGRGPRIRELADRLGLPCVGMAMKPMPWGLWKAAHWLDAAPDETAMVGDQLFADILAARLAGVRSILVEPMHPEEEPWYTRLKRWPEQFVLERIAP